jgi:single-strand DNA-binding protein
VDHIYFNHTQAGKTSLPLAGSDVFSAWFFNQRRNFMSLNHIVLIGRLGKTPEVLTTSKKGMFVRFSLATTKKYIASDGQVKNDTQWHTVYVRNGRGKAAVDYLKKGSKVCVRGELRNSEWQDEEGKQHFATAVYAQELIFLDSKSLEKAEVDPALLEEAMSSATTTAENDLTASNHTV